ncbi:autophagy- protein 2 [Cladochytrium tenue]|nr:autophagy- protein 2 [Cladochytrium tenue]
MLASLQKRLALFLLRRTLGQFLDSDRLDDPAGLDVQLLSLGEVVLRDVRLNIAAVNERLRGTPVRLRSGTVGQITASVPWRDLWAATCALEAADVRLEVEVVDELGSFESATGSVLAEEPHILSSSVHFAGDFLRSDAASPDEDDLDAGVGVGGRSATAQTGDVEGVQLLARLIDHVLSTVGFSLRNVEVAVHTAASADTLVFCLPSIAYVDETPAPAAASGISGVLAPVSVKALRCSGFSFRLERRGGDGGGGATNQSAPVLLLAAPYSDEATISVRVRQVGAAAGDEDDAEADTEADYGAESVASTMYATATGETLLARSVAATVAAGRRRGIDLPTWDVFVDFTEFRTVLGPAQVARLGEFLSAFRLQDHSDSPRVPGVPSNQGAEESGPNKSFRLTVTIGEYRAYVFTSDEGCSHIDVDAFMEQPNSALELESDHFLMFMKGFELVYSSSEPGSGLPVVKVSIRDLELADWIAPSSEANPSDGGRGIPVGQYITLLSCAEQPLRSVLESYSALAEARLPAAWRTAFPAAPPRNFKPTVSVSARPGGDSGWAVAASIDVLTVLMDLRLADRVASFAALLKDALPGQSPEPPAEVGSPLETAIDMHVQADLHIATTRVWFLVPSSKATTLGQRIDYPVRAESLLLEVDGLHVFHHPGDLSAAQLGLNFRAVGGSLARSLGPLFGDYAVRPFLFLGPAPPIMLSQQSCSGSVAIAVHLKAGPAGGQAEAARSEPLVFRDSPDSEDDVGNFGFQSWYDVGDRGAGAGEHRGLDQMDEDEDPFVGVGKNSKVYVDLDLGGIFIHAVKEDVDLLQILLNELDQYQRNSAAAATTATATTQLPAYSSTVLQFTPRETSRLAASFASEDPGAASGATAAGMHTASVAGRVGLVRVVAHAPGGSPETVYVLEVEALKAFFVAGLGGKLPSISILGTFVYDKELDMKESFVHVSLSGFSLDLDVGSTLAIDMAALFKEPAGIEYPDDLNRFTKLSVSLSSFEIEYRPLYRPVRVKVAADRLKFGDLAPVLRISLLNLSMRFSDGLISPKFELEVMNDEVVVDTCADTLTVLSDTLHYIASNGDFPTEIPAAQKPQKHSKGKSPAVQQDVPVDVLADLDENEFARTAANIDLAKPSDPQFVPIDDFDSSLADGEYLRADVSDRAMDQSDVEGCVQVFDDPEAFVVSHDHFALHGGSAKDDDEDEHLKPVISIVVKEVSISWRLFDGQDWQTRAETGTDLDFDESVRLEHSMTGTDSSGDSFFQDLGTAGSPPPGTSESAAAAASASSPSTNKPAAPRSSAPRVEARLLKLSADYTQYADDAPRVSRLALRLRDAEVIDNLHSSSWRKFLAALRPGADQPPRETEADLATAEVVMVRPNPAMPAQEEARLKVQVLPLRLHIDQDALMFLIEFFSQGSPASSPTNGPSPKVSERDPRQDIFFQFCHLHAISLKIDYKPKHVNYRKLKDGSLIEVMNFFPLDGAEMTLRDVRLSGVKGWSRLGELVVGKWLPYIRSTQVPRVVSGVSGVRSIVNLGSGIANLVLLPIEQYRRDGRIVRGLQKGARSFARTATMETLRLGTRMAVGTQVLLEQADALLTGGSGSESPLSAAAAEAQAASAGRDGSGGTSKLSQQPRDLREGVGAGYRSVARGLGSAARTILAVPTEVRQSQGSAQAVVIRAVPVAILKPMIGATELVSQTLMGLQNSLDPAQRLQMEDKYKASFK